MQGVDSPDSENYYVGKGQLSIRKEGDSTYVLLGNVPTFELTGTVTKLDHYSSMAGIKIKDKSVVTEKSATVRIIMDEFTAGNLALALLGDVDSTNPTNPIVNVMSQDAVTAELRFMAANDIGPRWNIYLVNVEFIPSKALNLIADTWGQIEVTGEATAVNGSFGTMTLITAVPTNNTPPSLTGVVAHPSLLTCNPGVWTGDPDLTFQWLEGSATPTAPIPGATGSTYNTVAGDVGKLIACSVTATNGFGAAAPLATSALGPIT